MKVINNKDLYAALDLQKEINQMIENSNNLNMNINDTNSKLIDNMQKVLEEEYEINRMSLDQELNLNQVKDIEKYTSLMEKEKD